MTPIPGSPHSAEGGAATDGPHRRSPVPNQHFGYKQTRSRETFERLLRAAQALIEEGDSADTLSITDVCDRAGLSVGAFYRRFESREGLLTCLHERYVERVFEMQAYLLDPARWEGVDIAKMIERVVQEAFEMTRRDQNFVRAIEFRAQADPEFAQRERQVHADYQALFARLLLQRVERIGHRHPRRAAEYCAYQVRAVLYYYFVTTSMLGRPPEQLSEGDIAQELAESLCAYLQVRDV